MNWKKIALMISWIGIFTYLLIVVGFTTRSSKSVPVNNIQVSITDSAKNSFLSKSEVVSMLDDNQILGQHRGDVNTHRLEKKIETHSAVENAEVYTNIEGELNIEIEQRKPVLRVQDRRGNPYYIDENGKVMPLSKLNAAHVLVASGHIPVLEREKIKTYNFAKQSKYDGFGVIYQLFTLTGFIRNNEFWNAQIEQIYVNKAGEFELIPRVGAHIIYLGSIENYAYKFKKLYALYTKGLNVHGWNKYEKINLKYKNQVICTKR